jgi:hypothetical protein
MNKIGELTPSVRLLLQQVVDWDADRQQAEYEQIDESDERWEELSDDAYRIVSDLAEALSVELGYTSTSPWREGWDRSIANVPRETSEPGDG